MKIVAFEVREDEQIYFEQMKQKYNETTLALFPQKLSEETIGLCEGAMGVSVLGFSLINKVLIDKLVKMGIKYISTRTIGYDHIDVEYAKTHGLIVCNSSYPPNGVAEYTVMLMLMTLRHYKPALYRGQVNNFSLGGLQGRELNDLTVGILGTGKIGSTVIQILSGFGCKILAYDPYPNPLLDEKVTYVEIEDIYREADVISLHVPYFKENYHLINDEEISKMKKGVTIINAARGELISVQALIRGIESEQIGALGLDTVEHEKGLVHIDHKVDILQNRDIAYLRQFPNVVMTPHMAFYTNTATRSMVETSINGIMDLIHTGETKNIV
ncbi:MAG: D-isomer specific 2-hydroxyacid dehydrogenase family protein [Erysipelotrichaceae bacterium]